MASVEPFLRWAGGKRWLAKTIAPLLRSRLKEGGHYYEPFLGSGAMFFSADPERAVLSDLNEELIITFRQVASGAEQITQALSQLGFGERLYYKIRNWRPQSDFDRAVRFIYLNRNC